jgi:enoyl-CoA hydratase/carnithine racemase
MTDEVVHYAVERAIATVTLDSPENRNALSSQLVTELSTRLAEAAADDGVRAVVEALAGPEAPGTVRSVDTRDEPARGSSGFTVA